MIDLAILSDKIRPCVEEAAAEVRRLFHSKDYQVSEKSPGDLLTSADLLSNEILRQGLMSALPEAAWISEESVNTEDRREREYAWIVDPIDGTREFASGVPEFSISVGLVWHGQAVLGMVALPAEGELIEGAVAQGVFLLDESGRHACGLTPPAASLNGARILVSATEHRRGVFRNFPGDLQFVPTGSVARKLALVAAGRADLNVSLYPKNEWDICGGCALVLAAGGLTLRFDETTKAWAGHGFNGENLRSLGLIAGSSELVHRFAEQHVSEGWPIHQTYGE